MTQHDFLGWTYHINVRSFCETITGTYILEVIGCSQDVLFLQTYEAKPPSLLPSG